MAIKSLKFSKTKVILATLLIVFGLGMFALNTGTASAIRSTTAQGGGGSSSQTDCTQGTCIDPAADPDVKCDKHDCDLIKKYLNPAINLFTMIFGIIAVASLIFGGIQYSASAGDPQNVAKAKKRIIDTIIAIVAYFFLYMFIQFLVPGGAF